MIIPTNKLFVANIQRLDIVVGMLFIEHYYKKNDYGYRLYELSKQHGPSKFIRLIKSFEHEIRSNEHGFKKNYLPITKDYYLNGDGVHRLACCLHFNIKSVPVKIIEKQYKYAAHRGLKWLQDTYCEKDIERIVDFYCKLYFTESEKIKNRINYLLNNHYDDTKINNVNEYKNLIFTTNNDD